jgi:hypothetical protein
MLYAAADALSHQLGATHVAFASGTCVPVARADGKTIPPPGTSFFKPFGFDGETMGAARSALLKSLKRAKDAAVREAAPAWAEAMQLYHQWCILAGESAFCCLGRGVHIFLLFTPQVH